MWSLEVTVHNVVVVLKAPFEGKGDYMMNMVVLERFVEKFPKNSKLSSFQFSVFYPSNFL